MKQPYASIYEYSMDELVFESGTTIASKDLQVFNTYEVIRDEKMLRPARSLSAWYKQANTK